MNASGLSALALVFVLLVPATAGAHAAKASSEPAAGSRLDAAPTEVSVDYTEPPTGDSVFTVFDGCRRNVVEDIEILNGVITASLGAGEPGRWLVSWQVISAVDGHATKDQMSFRVTGRADCSAPVPTPTLTQAAGDDGSDTGGQDSSLVPIVVVSAAIVGLGVVGRLVLR